MEHSIVRTRITGAAGRRHRFWSRRVPMADYHPPGWELLRDEPMWLLTLRVWLSNSWLDPRVRGFNPRAGRVSLAFPIALLVLFPVAYLLGRWLL